MRVPGGGEEADPDARWLATVMHVAFFVLLGSSLARFLIVHPSGTVTGWVIALTIVLAVLYVLGPVVGPREITRPGGMLWLAGLVAAWLALVVLAPSFGWCAVPLYYTALRSLSTRGAIVLVALITAFVVAAQVKLRLRFGFDPNLILAPPAGAAVATAVFIYTKRQAARLRTSIAELVRTRRELADTERHAGTLAERQRISMEIHDTLAQRMSSQQLLLQAADRLWDKDPAKARCHVRTAESIAAHNLTEARRFVHDLAPADLADGGGLDEALRTLAERETSDTLQIRFHQDGVPLAALPGRVQSALLRIAQGALANVREHADASLAVLTLSHLGDQVVLNVADNGRGFVPTDGPAGVRGHGLPAMRTRVRQLGGSFTIESAPGEGTVLSAAIPLDPAP